jgi:hypothetical protein
LQEDKIFCRKIIFGQNTMHVLFDVNFFTTEHTELTEVISGKKDVLDTAFSGLLSDFFTALQAVSVVFQRFADCFLRFPAFT